jgi:NADH-quinone oxidoreductase chain I
MLGKLFRIMHTAPHAVVGKHFLVKPITVQYPEEKLTLPEGYRGIHVFDIERCKGCAACARVCPNNCIEIKVSTTEDRKKKIEKYEIFLGRCMFCGLCEEFCVGGDVIRLTKDYEVAGSTRKDLVYDIKRLSRHKEEEK